MNKETIVKTCKCGEKHYFTNCYNEVYDKQKELEKISVRLSNNLDTAGIITENNIIKYLQEEIKQIQATRNVSRSIINGKLEIDDLLPLQEQEIRKLEKMIEHLYLMKKEIRYFETYKEMWLELYHEEKMPCGIEYMQELEAKYQDELMVWENE